MRNPTPVLLTAAAIGFFPLGLAAQSPVPERLVHARYLALGYDLGDRIVAVEQVIGDPWRVTPAERDAVDEIRSRLESWGRYVVVDRASQAELMLVIRSGRRASAGGGIGTGGGGGIGGVGVRTPGRSGGGQGIQPGFGGEISSPDDLLAVYDTAGAPGTPLWRAQASGGLSGEIPLFEAFQADVERAAARRKQR